MTTTAATTPAMMGPLCEWPPRVAALTLGARAGRSEALHTGGVAAAWHLGVGVGGLALGTRANRCGLGRAGPHARGARGHTRLARDRTTGLGRRRGTRVTTGARARGRVTG